VNQSDFEFRKQCYQLSVEEMLTFKVKISIIKKSGLWHVNADSELFTSEDLTREQLISKFHSRIPQESSNYESETEVELTESEYESDDNQEIIKPKFSDAMNALSILKSYFFSQRWWWKIKINR
jgi:hypothetical protein